jgi:hypothetical protein
VLPMQRVLVWPLDSIFPLGLRQLRLIKADVQGFECKVFEGATQLLSPLRSPNLTVLSSEVAASWLSAQCCGAQWLKHLLTPDASWSRTCTRKQGTDFTCVSRRRPSKWPERDVWPPRVLTGGERYDSKPCANRGCTPQRLRALMDGMAWCRNHPVEHAAMIQRRNERQKRLEQRRAEAGATARGAKADGGGGKATGGEPERAWIRRSRAQQQQAQQQQAQQPSVRPPQLPPLIKMAEAFKESLGITGKNVVEVVDAACSQLGVERGGPLLTRAEQAWSKLYGVGGARGGVQGAGGA